ncbi:nucleoside deaminase [Marmoricola sp. URHB0036]|uniref:nucleoside deaminase n=1 Tax=Marmoricola sp. URHB0036 TaxID=1298863 RepID=UPI00048481A2|nr:nucleoside deaminase [Marmoricola sp. URHB0036]
MDLDDTHRHHLRRCVELAREALEAGDDPFGSVLVGADGSVLAERRNRERTDQPLAHPEIDLAVWAGRHLSPDERAGATVYTSGEHCAMCSAAHGWVGLGPIVYAVSSRRLDQWRREWGAGASPVVTFSVNEVVPDLPVLGPDPELEGEMRELHERAFRRG